MNFTGRTAVITGAGSERGFGRTTALMMAERGCDIIAADLDAAGAKQTAQIVREKTGRKASGLAVNVADAASIEAMMKAAVQEFGRIDILVNNAGYTQQKKLMEISLEDWQNLLAVNLTGVFLCCQAVIPHMLENRYGRIVNISSLGAKNGGVTGGGHYCASKAGVIGFSKCVAKEVAQKGITVNCVAPGASKTDIGGIKFEEKYIPADIPMGRRGEREDIAFAVAFLACEQAGYITGATIDVNGGAYMD